MQRERGAKGRSGRGRLHGKIKSPRRRWPHRKKKKGGHGNRSQLLRILPGLGRKRMGPDDPTGFTTASLSLRSIIKWPWRPGCILGNGRNTRTRGKRTGSLSIIGWAHCPRVQSLAHISVQDLRWTAVACFHSVGRLEHLIMSSTWFG